MKQKFVKSLDIANYFFLLVQKKGGSITNKKLQKVLYYSQAWSLALRGVPLFEDPIEAWIHGPVVPKVYHHYKKSGFGPISIKPVTSSLSLEIQEFLDEVWRVYGKYDAEYLEILSHSEAPWILARGNIEADKACDNVISHESMRSFYSALDNGKKQ